MAIKNYITGDVPFLLEYNPYDITNNEICNSISEMVTFNLRPLTVPTEINYFVGANDSYVTTLKIKNITQNANLYIQVQFDREVFIINGVDDPSSPKNSLNFILKPSEGYAAVIEIKKKDLDTNTNYRQFLSKIVFSAKNLENGSIVFKNQSAVSLGEKYLPQEITVT